MSQYAIIQKDMDTVWIGTSLRPSFLLVRNFQQVLFLQRRIT
jgi:hypothetical protein